MYIFAYANILRRKRRGIKPERDKIGSLEITIKLKYPITLLSQEGNPFSHHGCINKDSFFK